VKYLVDPREILHRVRERSRHAPGAQKGAQTVLVLAALDHRVAGKKEPTGNPISKFRHHPHIRIAVRNEEIDLPGLDDISKGGEEVRMVAWEDEVVSIRWGLLEHKPIGIAADNEEGGVTGSQAPS
jgi:hypothetical protein